MPSQALFPQDFHEPPKLSQAVRFAQGISESRAKS
jgi:hypothetical protein